MGARDVSAARGGTLSGAALRGLGVAALLAATAATQAPKVERRAYARLCDLRNELLSALLPAEPDVRRRVADLLAEDVTGNPFLQIGEALAIARGVAADDAALHRAGVMAMVLPEVVDMDTYRVVHVTMHAPRLVPVVESCAFDIALLDADGETLRSGRITAETDLDSLLRFRATEAIPLDGLPDGRYRIVVESVIDERPPRPSDVAIDVPFHVLRGFPERAAALPATLDGTEERLAAAAELARAIPDGRRDPLSHAILNGALWQVERSFAAEPRRPGVDAVEDLERAERIYANLVEDRDALDGIHGRVTIGLPASLTASAAPDAEIALVSLDLPTPDAADEPKPLVLVVGGAPTWNETAHRPGSPLSVAPAWTFEQLRRAGFDAEGRFHVVAMESPGRFRNSPEAVIAVSRHLQRLLSVHAGQVFWIGEREGAWAVGRAAADHPSEVRGVVLVTAGALSRSELAGAPELLVLGVRAQSHVGNLALDAMPRHVDGDARVRLTDPDGVAWPIALGLRAAEIERFVRSACDE